MHGYRADIDGLRGVAIIAVVLYHAGIATVGGGFVGVDVFFVISGFLITRIISADIADRRFSFTDFYVRRAWRLLPALFVMGLATLVVGAAIMHAHEFEALARSAGAAAGFAANIWFLVSLDGYFAQAAEMQPLLHTWSLAVEEQFYFVLPVLLIAMMRFGAVVALAVVAVLAASSFGFSVWLTPRAPEAAFYLLPTRFFEMAAGALLAMGPRAGRFVDPAWLLAWRPLREAAALGGAALIAISIAAFDEAIRFPGYAAAIPAAGAAAVIAAGCAGPTLIGRLLAWRPLLLIGLMSYSLYLWHWPIMVYGRLLMADMAGPMLTASTLALSLVVAALSWRYVETPFRRGAVSWPAGWTRVSALAAPAAVALLAVAALTPAPSGGASAVRASGGDRVEELLALHRDRPASPCHNATDLEAAHAGALCPRGADAGVVARVALIGDSHADALSPALHEAARRGGWTFWETTGSWCAPLDDFASPAHSFVDCRGVMSAALRAVAADPDVETVILAAQWANYTKGQRWGSPRVAYTDALSPGYDPAANPAVFARALARTIRLLQDAGKRVVIVSSVPELTYPAPAFTARRAMLGFDPEAVRGMALAAYADRNAEVAAAFAALAARGIDVVDAGAAFCDSGAPRCRLFDEDGALLYADANHLSRHGADQLVAPVLEALHQAP